MIKNYQNNSCSLRVCHERARILAWQPQCTEDVLWCAAGKYISDESLIRVRTPICWSWFGEEPLDNGSPSHSFAILLGWSLLPERLVDDKTHRFLYQLIDDNVTNEYHPHDFSITLEYVIGKTLSISLVVKGRNSGMDAPSYGAFHSYFNIGDILTTEIEGLGTQSIDNVRAFQVVNVRESVNITEPTEKRFECSSGAGQEVRTNDNQSARTIVLTQSGHSEVCSSRPAA